ncbi:MAG: T9SS type A sorting domain-containing protein [Crocinitomicaceae bacterium]
MKAVLVCFTFCLSFLSFSQSFDQTTPISVSTGEGNYHPQVEVLNDGNPAVIWTDFSQKDLYFAKYDGISAFEPSIQLNPPGFNVQSYNWSGPDFWMEGDNVYVIFRSEGYNTGHIYLVKSTDNGDTFSDTVRVDQLATGFGQYPDVAVLNDTVWVTFMDHNDSGLDPQYVVARSTDGGLTFEQEVAAGSLWNAEACDCCQPEIVVDESKVVVFFRNNDNNTRDIKAVVSYDRGVTFTDMFSVDNHNWYITSCPSTGPDARFLSENKVLATYKTTVSNIAEIYVNQYDIAADASDALVQITATGAANQQLNYPQLDAKNGVMGIVWEGSGQSIDVFINTSSSGAAGLNPDNAFNLTDASGAQNKPDIAVGDGLFHVVYADGGNVKYTQLTALLSFEEIENELDCNVYPNPATDEINFEFDPAFTENGTLKIYNALGQAVLQREITKGAAININTQLLESGVYHYSVESNSGSSVGQFTVN